ncbi:hypothetical protein EON66_01725, partial [archaeon]
VAGASGSSLVDYLATRRTLKDGVAFCGTFDFSAEEASPQAESSTVTEKQRWAATVQAVAYASARLHTILYYGQWEGAMIEWPALAVTGKDVRFVRVSVDGSGHVFVACSAWMSIAPPPPDTAAAGAAARPPAGWLLLASILQTSPVDLCQLPIGAVAASVYKGAFAHMGHRAFLPRGSGGFGVVVEGVWTTSGAAPQRAVMKLPLPSKIRVDALMAEVAMLRLLAVEAVPEVDASASTLITQQALDMVQEFMCSNRLPLYLQERARLDDTAGALRLPQLLSSSVTPPSLIMAPVGVPLQSILNKWSDSTERTYFLMIVLVDLLLALRHAHRRRLLHRDVRPPNILWVWNQDAVNHDPPGAEYCASNGRAMLIDWGLAVRDDDPRTNETCGNVAFLPQRQLGASPQAYTAGMDVEVLLYALFVLKESSPTFLYSKSHAVASAQLSDLHKRVAFYFRNVGDESPRSSPWTRLLYKLRMLLAESNVLISADSTQVSGGAGGAALVDATITPVLSGHTLRSLSAVSDADRAVPSAQASTVACRSNDVSMDSCAPNDVSMNGSD